MNANANGIEIENLTLDVNGRIEVLDDHLLDEIVGASQELDTTAEGVDPTTDINAICNFFWCGE